VSSFKGKEVFNKGKIFIILVTLFCTACVGYPIITSEGAKVRIISIDESKHCDFVQIVQYNDRILKMGRNRVNMKAIGDTNIRNQVARTGGNSFLLVKEEINLFFGSIAFQAKVFLCPQ